MSETTIKRKLSDTGCILLPARLRGTLGWAAHQTITATYNPKNNSVVLSNEEQEDSSSIPFGISLTIDELGCIALPKKLRNKIGWLFVEPKDTIALTLCPWERTITLTLFEKYEEKCVFCKKPEIITSINDIGVCKSCAERIAKAC